MLLWLNFIAKFKNRHDKIVEHIVTKRKKYILLKNKEQLCRHCIYWQISGVSCDSCLKNNFRGRRYKCLICIDYDLCATCYESGATTNQHTTEHPMQCILSRSDFGKTNHLVFNIIRPLTKQNILYPAPNKTVLI